MKLIFLSSIFLARARRYAGTIDRPAPDSRASSSSLPDDRNDDFMDEAWFKAGLLDDQGDGLCAVTAVDGSFKEFIPSFVDSLYRSHPRSKAIVLVADPLPPHLDKVLAQNSVPRHSYRVVVHGALRNTTGKFGSLRHPQSSRMAAARFLAIDAVAGHGCRWVYYSDVDIIFFRSESTENKSIVRWHTERMLRTRLGPFDNVVRPKADFLGCGTPAGERLTGLHFVAWEPWIQKVGPCLRTALSMLSTQSVSGWCSTKNGFLDEHLLWYSAQMCGVNPGPRMVSRNISVERPIHGYHVHSRPLEHPSDLHRVCNYALPFARHNLREPALSLFERSARIVGCAPRPSEHGRRLAHLDQVEDSKTSRAWWHTELAGASVALIQGTNASSEMFQSHAWPQTAWEFSVLVNFEYARRHGHLYRLYLYPQLPRVCNKLRADCKVGFSHWQKVRALATAMAELAQSRVFVWLDTDVLLRNQSMPLSAYFTSLAYAPPAAVPKCRERKRRAGFGTWVKKMQGDEWNKRLHSATVLSWVNTPFGCNPNTGILFWRRSDSAIKLLRAWWNYNATEEKKMLPWRDQPAFFQTLQQLGESLVVRHGTAQTFLLVEEDTMQDKAGQLFFHRCALCDEMMPVEAMASLILQQVGLSRGGLETQNAIDALNQGAIHAGPLEVPTAAWQPAPLPLLQTDRRASIIKASLKAAGVPIGAGQQTINDRSMVVAALSQHNYTAKMLIFGTGRDSRFWAHHANHGRTVFLEDNQKWARIDTSLEVHLVKYHSQPMKDWRQLAFPFFNTTALTIDGPADLWDECWDVLLIDGPKGYLNTHPGRMASIYQAGQQVSKQARSGCGPIDVFVHDFDRQVEREWAFLCLATDMRFLNYHDFLASQQSPINVRQSASHATSGVDGVYMAHFRWP